MSQPAPLAPDTAGDSVYRPLSLLAVGSLALAALYAALVVSGGLLAFVHGTPYFWPESMLLMPLTAGALSVFARWRIARSEDTLAGDRLARWAFWLSVVAGLGYGAYFLTTGLAVKHQAGRFLSEKGPDSGFLPRLLEGDVNAAFLLTVPPSRRDPDLNPADQEAMEAQFDLSQGGPSTSRGPLSKFRESEIVQALVQCGKEKREDGVQELGVKDWSWEGGAYKVERTYRITNSEVTFDVLITTRTDSDPSVAGRKWWVDLKATLPNSPLSFTARGVGVMSARGQARAFLSRLTERLKEGAKAPEGIKDRTDWEKLRAIADAEGDAAEARRLAREELYGLLQGRGRGRPNIMLNDQPMAAWEVVDGRVRVIIPFMYPVQLSPNQTSARYVADGEFRVQTRQAVDLESVPEALSWDVESFRVLRVVPSSKKGP
jgi:hypothetical protein